MQSSDKPVEPSMEDILASIRKIISEEPQEETSVESSSDVTGGLDDVNSASPRGIEAQVSEKSLVGSAALSTEPPAPSWPESKPIAVHRAPPQPFGAGLDDASLSTAPAHSLVDDDLSDILDQPEVQSAEGTPLRFQPSDPFSQLGSAPFARRSEPSPSDGSVAGSFSTGMPRAAFSEPSSDAPDAAVSGGKQSDYSDVVPLEPEDQSFKRRSFNGFKPQHERELDSSEPKLADRLRTYDPSTSSATVPNSAARDNTASDISSNPGWDALDLGDQTDLRARVGDEAGQTFPNQAAVEPERAHIDLANSHAEIGQVDDRNDNKQALEHGDDISVEIETVPVNIEAGSFAAALHGRPDGLVSDDMSPSITGSRGVFGEPLNEQLEPATGASSSVRDVVDKEITGMPEGAEFPGVGKSMPDRADVAVGTDTSVVSELNETSPVSRTDAAVTRTLEDTVSELLRPMLRGWLDEHLPRIVEKALREELAEHNREIASPDQD